MGVNSRHWRTRKRGVWGRERGEGPTEVRESKRRTKRRKARVGDRREGKSRVHERGEGLINVVLLCLG